MSNDLTPTELDTDATTDSAAATVMPAFASAFMKPRRDRGFFDN